jgi:hypothetical protein
MSPTANKSLNPLSPKERVKVPRQLMPEQPADERNKNFEEVNLGYSPELARQEALRCVTLHFLGRQSVITPDNCDDGNVDVRINILGSFDGRTDPQQQNQQRQDHKRIWTPQREPDNPHLSFHPPVRHGKEFDAC